MTRALVAVCAALATAGALRVSTLGAAAPVLSRRALLGAAPAAMLSAAGVARAADAPAEPRPKYEADGSPVAPGENHVSRCPPDASQRKRRS